MDQAQGLHFGTEGDMAKSQSEMQNGSDKDGIYQALQALIIRWNFTGINFSEQEPNMSDHLTVQR